MSGEEIKIKNEKVLDGNPCQTNSDWFVREGESTSDNIYPPKFKIGFTPLINGIEIFPELEAQIRKATKSIDIISWGFDPTLMLGGPKENGTRLGQLLLDKAAKGIEVRVLIWELAFRSKIAPKLVKEAAKTFSPEIGVKRPNLVGIHRFVIVQLDQENSDNKSWINKNITSKITPEKVLPLVSTDDFSDFVDEHVTLTFEKETKLLEKFIEEKVPGGSALPVQEVEDMLFSEYNKTAYSLESQRFGFPASTVEDYDFTIRFFVQTENRTIDQTNKISFRVRESKNDEVSRSLSNSKVFKEDSSFVRSHLLSNGATHHQKMVLIDYEIPEKAIGFVMGHNLHKDYFDNQDHNFFSADRWPGFRPWQDISSMVQGPVLFDLNDNFSKAWDKASDEGLYNKRSEIKEDAFMFSDEVPINPKIKYLVKEAQICRTEPSYQEQTILALYKKAFSNVKNFMYIENQYFRYGPLSTHLKDLASKRKKGNGEIPGSKNDTYLFVVTNQPNSDGEVAYTVDMLSRLGYEDVLPLATRDVTEEYLTQLRNQKSMWGMGKLIPRTKDIMKHGPKTSGYRLDTLRGLYPDLTKKIDEQLENKSVEELLEEAKNKKIHNVENTKEAEDAIEIREIENVKVIVASLRSGYQLKSGKYYYTNVYVHSKLLIVDDAFLTLGSANINTRSFKADTELSIAVPDGLVAKETRTQLWTNHVKTVYEDTNINDMAEQNYILWKKCMDDNWKAMHEKEAIIGTLTHLHNPAAIAGIPLD